MVKNLPSVERSTKIRFGKHVPDSDVQAENTVVFNASNVLVPTPYSNAVYLSPIRNRPDYTPPEVVLLMYDRVTKEITESGESANALVGGATLSLAVNRSNIASNTVQLISGPYYNAALVTDSNVGIANFFPQHTLSIGSNLYVDDVGSNVLVVSGNVAVLKDMIIEGNLTVNGDTTVIYTENTSIKDAFIELGRDNTSGDTTLDLGILMHRPDTLSNVVIGYREGTDEFAIAYTDAQPTDKTFTPKTGEDINVHVYGLTHIDANIYAHEDLLVTGNVYVTTNVSITEELTVSNNVYADKDLEVMGNVYVDGNVVAYKDLLVTGNVYVATNVSITEELTVSNNVYADKDLEVVGNVYVDGNVVAYKDLLVTGNVYVSTNVSITEELTVSNNVYADKDLEVVGNVYVDGNVVAYQDLLVTGNVYVATNVSITEELTVSNNVYADKDLEVVGNVYVDGNVVAYKDLLVTGNVYVSTNVSITEELTVSNNVYADKDLEVMGNVYVDGNVVAYKDLLVTGNVYVSTNASITEELTVSGNVYADKDLEVMGNVYADGNVVAYQDLLVTGNTYATGNITISNQLIVTGNVYANKDFKLAGNAYVTGNVNITKQLSVSGNAYVSGNVEVTESLIVSANTHLKGDNVFITHTMDFLDPKTAIVTDQVSNVQIRLGQLENVANTASNPLNNQVLMYEGGQWTNLFPNHSFLTIKNDTAYTMVSGNVVYVSGYQNQNLALVRLAKADSAATMPAIGVVYTTSIPPAGEGLAVAYGKVNQMNTNGYQVGETVYVSNTYAGWISNVKPYYTDSSADLIQNVGVVTRQDTDSGAIFVTGIGRSNDVPNARIETSNASVNYVYVNSVNNDFRKIDPMKLPTKLQPLTFVVNTGNTASNAVTLNGVQIQSGSGFHGDLVVAGNVTVDTETFKVDAEANRVGILTASPGYPLDVRGAANVGTLTVTNGTITDATHSTSKDTGVLIITNGGLGVEANIHTTNVFAASHIAVGTSATTKALDVRGTSNVGIFTTPDATVTDSTPSTSKTSGALKVTGGAGIQGALYGAAATFDGITKVINGTDASSTTSGALQVTGGVGIQKDLYARDGHFSTDVSVGSLSNKTIPYANSSKILVDSPISREDNGDIVITGDLQITGNLLVAGNTSIVSANNLVVSDRIIDIANNNPEHALDIGILMEHPGHNIGIIHHGAEPHELTFGYTQNGYGDSHVLWDTSNHMTVNVWGHVITQNTITVEYNDVYIVGGGLGIGIGDRSGDNKPHANIHVVGNVHVTSNISTASNVLITGDAAATSKTTGALQVTGGVGISGALYAAGLYTDDYLVHSGDLDTKVGFPQVDTFTVTTANNERVRVDSAGRVGIQTNAPTSNLHVVGNVYATSNITTASNVLIQGTAAATSKTTGALQVAGGVGISGALYGAAATFSGAVSTGALTATSGAFSSNVAVNTNDLFVDTISQRVGLGTTLPQTYLHLSAKNSDPGATEGDGIGTHTLTEYLRFTSTFDGGDVNAVSVGLKLGGDDNSTISPHGRLDIFANNGADAGNSYGQIPNNHIATFIGDGNVGIGTTSPAYKLDVNGTTRVASLTASGTTQATSLTTGALTVAGGISTQTNVHAANVYISGGLITNTAGVTKKTYAYSGTIGNTEQPYINVCFTNESFSAKVTAQLIEGDDEISTITFDCCGGNKVGGTTLSTSAIQTGSIQVFGPASTNPWSSTVVTDKKTVAMKPSGAIDTSGEYHIFVEYLSAKGAGAVANVVQNTTQKIAFGY